jgi:hypothetical protein
MPGLKITELDANSSPLTTDLLTIVDDPAGTALSQKITIANLLTLFCSNVVVQTFVANGTYTPTAGMKKCLAICVGGGGGGAGGLNTDSAGGGGGGGGTAIKLFTAADIGASKTVHVGAAGLGQTSSQAATAGGESHLGADASEIVNATGGNPGTAGTGWSSGTPLAASGGTGGAGTVGDLLIAGSPGHKGIIYSGTTGWGGEGGATSFGAGGLGPAINTAGAVGRAYGGGGGGGHASATSDRNGGNGAIGIVYVIEFLG